MTDNDKAPLPTHFPSDGYSPVSCLFSWINQLLSHNLQICSTGKMYIDTSIVTQRNVSRHRPSCLSTDNRTPQILTNLLNVVSYSDIGSALVTKL